MAYEQAHPSGLTGNRIVLLDADERLRNVVTELLTDEGAHVVMATANASAAVTAVRTKRPDAVIVHLTGNRTETLLLIDAVRRWRRDQPVVVFSSLANPALEPIFARRGVELVPPADGIDGLGAAVRRAIRATWSPLTDAASGQAVAEVLDLTAPITT